MPMSALQMELAEHLSDGKSTHDAALACGIGHPQAMKALAAMHGHVYRAKPSRGDFASSLAAHLYERGHLAIEPSGGDWDDLLADIRRFLARHRLVPPGAYRWKGPGSAQFSRTEQMAMVRKYERAVAERRSTLYIGNLFLRWGVTAPMMSKWRRAYLGNRPHLRFVRAEEDRKAVVAAIAKSDRPICFYDLLDALDPMAEVALRNRLKELLRSGRVEAIRIPGGRQRAYRAVS